MKNYSTLARVAWFSVISSLTSAACYSSDALGKEFQAPATCTDLISLTTQAEVNAYPATYGCTAITNMLFISGSDITSLDSLYAIEFVGTLRLYLNSNLTSLRGLSGLTYLGGLEVSVNDALTDIDALSSLPSINGPVSISSNAVLRNVDGLRGVAWVSSSLTISSNPNLTSIDGLSALEWAGSVGIVGNGNLGSIEGLSSLRSSGFVDIRSNPILRDLEGLNNLEFAGGLQISRNQVLTNIDALGALDSVSTDVAIVDNPALPDIRGLSGIRSIKFLSIWNNDALTSLDGLEHVATIDDILIHGNATLADLNGLSSLERTNSLTVLLNAKLANLDGLSSLRAIGTSLEISYNAAVTNLDGLSGLQPGVQIQKVVVSNNALLTNIDGLSACASVGTGGLILTYNPSLLQVDSLHALRSIAGSLYIANNNSLTSIRGFSSLETVGGDVAIYANNVLASLEGLESLRVINGGTSANGIGLLIEDNGALTSLDGLSSLEAVGLHVTIGDNSSLRNVDGLARLSAIGGRLLIYRNNRLVNLDGLSSLTSITEGQFPPDQGLIVAENPSLVSIEGLKGIRYVHGELRIEDNDLLPDLDGLDSLERLDGFYGTLAIRFNSSLTNIDALSSLRTIPGALVLTQNPSLVTCCGLYAVLAHSGVGRNVTISANGAGCTRDDIVAGGPCPHDDECPGGGQIPHDKQALAENGWGYAPHSTNVVVQNHQPGILYELFLEADGTAAAGPSEGNVGLFVENVTQTTEYYVIARDPQTGCGRELTSHPIIHILESPSECAHLPEDKNIFSEMDIVPQGATTNILVGGAEDSVLYVLRYDSDDLWVSGPYPGYVGLNTGPVYEATTFNVLAIEEKTSCIREMSSTVTVSVSSTSPAREGSDSYRDGVEVTFSKELPGGGPHFSIYPNPGNGDFEVAVEGEYYGPCLLRVLDLSGRTVGTQEFVKDVKLVRTRVDLAPLANGIYIVSVFHGTTTRAKLVVR